MVVDGAVGGGSDVDIGVGTGVGTGASSLEEETSIVG